MTPSTARQDAKMCEVFSIERLYRLVFSVVASFATPDEKVVSMKK